MNWLQRTVVSFALALCACASLALDYGRLGEAIRQADSAKEVQSVLKRFKVSENADPQLRELASALQAKPFVSPAELIDLRQAVRLRELAVGGDPGAVAIDAEKVQRLKDSPLYHDPGVQQESNWLREGMRAFGEWVRGLFQFPEPEPSRPIGPNLDAFSGLITTLAWAILALAVVTCAALIGRSVVNQRNKATKKLGGLISEDEARLTLDEWLAKADELTRLGQFREAIRCLYVASLLRLDESKVLEFRRDETNWEHVNRYREAPLEYDLASSTHRFDLVWYGNRACSAENVGAMRLGYEALTASLRKRRASA